MKNLPSYQQYDPIVEYFIGVAGSDLTNEIVCQYIDAVTDSRELETVEGLKVQVYSVSRQKMEELKRNSTIRNKIQFYSKYGDGKLRSHTFGKKKVDLMLVRPLAGK